MADGRFGKVPGKMPANTAAHAATSRMIKAEHIPKLRPDLPKMHFRNEPTRIPFDSARSTINCSKPLPLGSLLHNQIHKDLVPPKH
jgi:hypothetical protein